MQQLVEDGALEIAAATASEVLSGARSGLQVRAVEALAGTATVVPLGLPAGRMSAALRRHLDRRGEGIGAMDPLIAGTAIQAGAALVTRNRRHFDRVPGLRVLDP